MFATMRVVLSTAIALSIATTAFATSGHRTHSRQTAVDERVLPARVYGSSAQCSRSNRMALSRFQPGEAAVIIQDRGYRESIGFSFDEGECW
jgi:hypothetical protein